MNIAKTLHFLNSLYKLGLTSRSDVLVFYQLSHTKATEFLITLDNMKITSGNDVHNNYVCENTFFQILSEDWKPPRWISSALRNKV